MLISKICTELNFGQEYIFRNDNNIFKGIIDKFTFTEKDFRLHVRITMKSKICKLSDKVKFIIISLPTINFENNNIINEFDGNFRIFKDIKSMSTGYPVCIYTYNRSGLDIDSDNTLSYNIESIDLNDILSNKSQCKADYISSLRGFQFYRYKINKSTIEKVDVNFKLTVLKSFVELMLFNTKETSYRTVNDAIIALEDELKFK